MRVLVTGSRDWAAGGQVRVELYHLWWLHGSLVVVHGSCPTGADAFAEEWVSLTRRHGNRSESHPANWNKYGKAAGPIRNRAMVEAGAEICLAFIRNGSRGASHCADLAEKAGIKTIRFEVSS